MSPTREFWKDYWEQRAEEKRQERRAWLERQGRELNEIDRGWGPESNDDDPYGEYDKAHEELE